MQSLGLAEAQEKLNIRMNRNPEQMNAVRKKRVSMYAIRAALAQCKVLRSGGNGDTPFANCVLARLFYILLEIDPEAAEEVLKLVRGYVCMYLRTCLD